MNKYLMKKNLQIYTATYIEKFPGYIYIEADREIHVREAIKDLTGTNIKGNCYVRIIPVKEVILPFLIHLSKRFLTYLSSRL